MLLWLYFCTNDPADNARLSHKELEYIQSHMPKSSAVSPRRQVEGNANAELNVLRTETNSGQVDQNTDLTAGAVLADHQNVLWLWLLSHSYQDAFVPVHHFRN